MERFALTFMLVILSVEVSASNCCGQNPTAFPVLSLQQRLTLSSSFGIAHSQGRVGDNGDFNLWSDRRREVQSTQLSLASSVSPRHQLFMSGALLRGVYADRFGEGAETHMGDMQLGFTYELLPEYQFSYWKPVVYVSFIANLPTGNSIYENSTLSEGAGVTGHGQWGVGIGLTVRKVYFPFTVLVQLRTLQVLARDFAKVSVSDFFDSSAALFINYDFGYKGLTLLGGGTLSQMSPRKISSSNQVSGPMESVTALIGVQKTLTDQLSAGLSYSDQTFLGPARNTLLNRTYALNFNYNYF